jgi:phasin family protein
MAKHTDQSNSDAPFAQAMDQARTAAEGFSKMFSDLKLPATPDMEALISAQKRNLDAMTAANRIAMEGAQAVAKRHMQIMQQTMTEMTEVIRAATGVGAPQEKAAQQTEMLKRSYEHAVANTKELADIIQNANSEALSLLNRRFTEAMDEVKALMAKSAKTS